jgi:hypothetical protein
MTIRHRISAAKDSPPGVTIELPGGGGRKRAKDVKWEDIPRPYYNELKKESVSLTWELWMRLKDMADSQYLGRSEAVQMLIRNHAAGYTHGREETAQPPSSDESMLVTISPVYRRVLALAALKAGTTPEVVINALLKEHLVGFVRQAETAKAEVTKLERELLQEGDAQS